MDASLLVSIILGVLGLLSGGYIGLKTVRSTTAADKQRVADAVQKRIDDAAKSANDAAQVRLAAKDERIADLLRDLANETERANRAESRAEALQTSINDRGLGPIR